MVVGEGWAVHSADSVAANFTLRRAHLNAATSRGKLTSFNYFRNGNALRFSGYAFLLWGLD